MFCGNVYEDSNGGNILRIMTKYQKCESERERERDFGNSGSNCPDILVELCDLSLKILTHLYNPEHFLNVTPILLRYRTYIYIYIYIYIYNNY